MKLSKLIEAVGDDNVEVQNIDQSLVSADINGPNAEIAFSTDHGKVVERLTENKTEWVGLVVWIPRKLIPKQ